MHLHKVMYVHVIVMCLPYVDVTHTNSNSDGWSQENTVFVAWNRYCIVPAATDRLQSCKQHAYRLSFYLIHSPLDSSAAKTQAGGKGNA